MFTKRFASSASSSTPSSSSSSSTPTVPVTPAATNVAPAHGFRVSSNATAPVHPYTPVTGLSLYQAKPGDTTITLYPSSTPVFVKNCVDIQLKNQSVTIPNLPSTLIPSSVSFFSLTEPTAKVLSQELNKPQDSRPISKVLTDNAGKTVKIINHEYGINVEGVLVGVYDNSAFVATSKPSSSSTHSGTTVVPLLSTSVYEIPEEFHPATTHPTTSLAWTLDAKSDTHLAEITYECTGVKWEIAYTGIINSAFTAVHLTGWYTISNTSGTDYNNAQIVIFVNEVSQVEPNYYSARKERRTSISYVTSMLSAPEKKKSNNAGRVSYSKEKLYRLERRITLNNRQTLNEKAVDVIVPIKRFYLAKASAPKFNGKANTDEFTPQESSLQQVISFQNQYFLPGGNLRLVQNREDGSVTSVTNKDDFSLGKQVVLVTMEHKADTVHRKRLELHVDPKRHLIRETFEVEIPNNQNIDLPLVIVEENMCRWHEWEVAGSATIATTTSTNPPSIPFLDLTCEKHEFKPNRISFSIPLLPKHTIVTITYTVVYSNYQA